MTDVTCRACQRPNRWARRFCGGCGTHLGCVCRSCGFANGADDRFCGGCGARVGDDVAVVTSPPVRPSFASLQKPSGELDGLFGKGDVDEPETLPAENVTQGDLDKLFGAAS